jgi:hypothetical protein
MLEGVPPEVPLNCSSSAENALRRGTTLASVVEVDVLDEVHDVDTKLDVLLEVVELVELVEDFVELLEVVEEVEDVVELTMADEELVDIADVMEDEVIELEAISDDDVVLEELDFTEKASYAPTPTTAITTIAITAIASGAIPRFF